MCFTKVGLYALVIVLLAPAIHASQIGYEIIDNNNTLYIWNNGTQKQDWYYNNKCLDELSNIYNETWEIVTKYLGREGGQDYLWFEWGDQFGCIRSDETDNQTYQQSSSLSVYSWGNNDLEGELISYIGVNDDLITQTYRFYSDSRTNFDVWFKLESHNITITGEFDNDFLIMQNRTNNETEYYNLTSIAENGQTREFLSTDYYPYWFLKDIAEQQNILNEWWDNSYEWKVIANGNVSLLVNLGEFARHETKYFTKKWVDASCTCSGFGLRATAYSQYPNGTVHHLGEQQNFTMGCSATLAGFGGSCSSCGIGWHSNQTGTWKILNVSVASGEYIDCPTGTNPQGCTKKLTGYGSGIWHNQTIQCENWGVAGTRCVHESHPAISQNTPSVANETFCHNATFYVNITLDSPPNATEYNISTGGQVEVNLTFNISTNGTLILAFIVLNGNINRSILFPAEGIIVLPVNISENNTYEWFVNASAWNPNTDLPDTAHVSDNVWTFIISLIPLPDIETWQFAVVMGFILVIMTLVFMAYELKHEHVLLRGLLVSLAFFMILGNSLVMYEMTETASVPTSNLLLTVGSVYMWVGIIFIGFFIIFDIILPVIEFGGMSGRRGKKNR